MSRMMKQAALGFLTLVAFHFGASPASAAVISDSVFNDSDWTHSILWSVGTVTLGPCGQVLTGGNPNEHQQGHHTTQDQFSGIYDGHLFVGGGTYDPGTDGPIATLDVSYDYRDVAGAFTTQNGLMIVQGIRTFLYFVDSAGPHPTWTSLSVTGITDIWNPAWVEVTGGVIINFTTPDFSISGLPMTFGYYTFNQFTADQTWGIDNFNVTIHSEPTPAEDASWGEVKASYR